eukprot:CAMPEP_0118690476 /NCGR_PEP_ID=MMETSP0800-20121206/10135_1 /TAXON_ID=210618 ORGANISM="Striatella unipunctata, Strain CCMP2910" /NCGR_SAMPLE_ID=MMETSP0800 /ASSEMBLY_ACC=CAM_ASM_000638 /LENGTH=54 /DNA_ID=CAMNT_0006588127 /DNA_START=25 /DNA_END=189 /DNA_ORIENTATION=-
MVNADIHFSNSCSFMAAAYRTGAVESVASTCKTKANGFFDPVLASDTMETPVLM